MNRQKKLLSGLVAVFLLALLYAYLTSPEQQTVQTPDTITGFSQGNTSPQAALGNLADRQKVNLELLNVDKKKYPGFKRDIFNYYRPKPKPAPKTVVAPKPAPKTVVAPKPAPVVTPQVRQELARFTFLGFLLKDNVRTVFLSKRDELFLVKKDEYFGENNQFEVVDITEEKLTIRQSGANGLIEIELVEEEPLIPSFTPGKFEPRPEFVPEEEPVAPDQPPGSSSPADARRPRWFRNVQPQAPAEN